MNFMQWTESRYLRPVVMVDATPAADVACLRNGFDVVQLLRPFSVLQNSSLTAHVGEKGEAVAVRNFGVRLVRRECVREAGSDTFRHHAQRVMRGAAAMDLAYGEQLDRAVSELVDPVKGGPVPSPARLSSPAVASTLLERSQPIWHSQFIKDYHTLVRCGDFETTDHPVGVIFAASTAEPGGIDGILRAFKLQAQRARQLKADVPNMDSEMHQYYILVHDVGAGQQAPHANEAPPPSPSPSAPSAAPTLQDARRYLAAVQQLHGSNSCALIRINSVLNPQDVKCLDPTPWIEANPICVDMPSDAAIAEFAATPPAAAAASPAAHSTSATTSGGSFAGPGAGSTAHANHTGAGATGGAALRFNRLHSIIGKWPNGVVKVTGCFMSPENVAEVKDVMGYYLAMSLLRFLERRLRVLDASVQDRRTTTLSKVANWFKSKEEVKPRMEVQYAKDGGPPRYLASSLEMMMRRCGDLSMFLQDYNGAIDFYKLCLEELMASISQRLFNRTVIAGCQEGIGIANFFLGKLIMPSATPWYTGGTRLSVKSGHTCRLEIALNDYLAGGSQVYALRLGFFLYEFCRTRSPPAMDRAKASLQHVLRSGLTNNNQLFAGIVSDMLATTSLFANPPYPAGLLMSPTGMISGLVGTGAFSMPAGYPVAFNLRTYVRFLLEAGARYFEVRSLEAALRCYLRVLEVLRVLGGRGCWGEMYEHVLMTVSRQYFSLGQNIKGLVMASAAVARGVPLYSNRQNGLENFQLFWDRQAKVLTSMGYSLSPHMPMPCIVRSSFQISYNPYFTDDATQAEGKRLGKHAAEQEWREMEGFLKSHFNKAILQSTSPFKFPSYHGELKKDLVFSQAQEGGRPTVTPAGGGGGLNGEGSSFKHYHIAHTEPLWLSFVVHNPVGGALTASNISILYMSRLKPDQLWKSAATKTITLEPGQKREVELAFSPLEPGEYVVIGLCWSLLGQEGYYYFATKESRKGCSESLYEYAIEHPAPSLDAEENITVTVTPPRAWVTAALAPPLPDRLRDGEYFHTCLVVTNGSAEEAAHCVTLQRSPQSAHLMYMEEFGVAKNLKKEMALPLADTLKPGESKSFPLTVRAQHDRGDATVQCMNNLFFLIGYLPGSPDSATAAAAAAAPPATAAAHANHKRASRNFSGNAVRLHRMLRRLEVVLLMALYSTVLQPSNASLSSSVVVTAKHIATVAGATRAAASLASSPALHAADESGSPVAHAKPPVRVSRVMVMHRSQWSVSGSYLGDLSADRAADCVIPAGSSLTLPLLVQRLPRQESAGRSTAGALSSPPSPPPPAEDEEVVEDVDSDAEEVEKGGVAAASSAAVYTDEECLPLRLALPSPSKAQALVANIGAGLADSPMNRYFMRTSFLGAGSVGHALEQRGDALAFYLDKAGQSVETRHEKRLAERRHERKAYGGLLEKYTPFVVGVAWLIDNGPEAAPSSGQLFHFADPVAFLQQPGTASATAAVLDDGAWEELCGTTASVEHQQHLCECLTRNRTTVTAQQGAVVYHARVPPSVESTAALPAAAVAPVVFRCLSLSPLPLLVDVAAAPPEAIASSHQASLPLMFVGKTKHSFLLLPSAVFEVEFIAHILLPGLTNCNCFQVTATPLLFQPGLDLHTGMSRGSLGRRIRSAMSGPEQPDTAQLLGSPSVSVTNRRASASASAALQASAGSFASRPGDEYDNDSLATGGADGSPELRPASLGTSVLSRTSRSACHHPSTGAGSSGSLANASLYASARGQFGELVLQLTPRGFHRKRVRVLGQRVPALTNARLLHLDATQAASVGPSFQEASAAAFAERNKLYAEEAATYEARAELFQARANARTSRSHNQTTFVYRPRVRVLSPSRTSSAAASSSSSHTQRCRDTASHAASDAARPAAPVSAQSTMEGSPGRLTATQAPSLDGIFGHAASQPAVLSAASANVNTEATASAPAAAAAATDRPATRTSAPSTPFIGPRKRPQGLVPLVELMPSQPHAVPCAAGVAVSSSPAVAGPEELAGLRDGPTPGTDAAADVATHPTPFSPIMTHAPSNPLGVDGGGLTTAVPAAPTTTQEDAQSLSASQLASPLQLPPHQRTFSQGVDITPDQADSGSASPVLLPHDASRIAFPVTEDEEDTSTMSQPVNRSRSMTFDPHGSTSTSTLTAPIRARGLAGSPLAADAELLPPSEMQQQAVIQRVAATTAAGARRGVRRPPRKDPFASSSSSSSSDEEDDESVGKNPSRQAVNAGLQHDAA